MDNQNEELEQLPPDMLTVLRNLHEWIETIEGQGLKIVFNRENVLLLKQISGILLQEYYKAEKGVWEGGDEK